MARMTHPDAEHDIDVRADQIPLYLSQGWQVKKSAAKPATDTGKTTRSTSA